MEFFTFFLKKDNKRLRRNICILIILTRKVIYSNVLKEITIIRNIMVHNLIIIRNIML